VLFILEVIMMQISMSKEVIATTANPHAALEAMRADLKALIEEQDHKYEWYIVTATNTDDGGLTLTAEYSEERKIHFEANPL
jgi:hypothetical protein